jgi:hypothetical protein
MSLEQDTVAFLISAIAIVGLTAALERRLASAARAFIQLLTACGGAFKKILGPTFYA